MAKVKVTWGKNAEEGELTFSGSVFSLMLSHEGDRLLLSGQEGDVFYERDGDMPFRMHFLDGEKTQMSFSNSKDTIPVYTKKAAVKRTRGGVKIKIDYILDDKPNLVEMEAKP